MVKKVCFIIAFFPKLEKIVYLNTINSDEKIDLLKEKIKINNPLNKLLDNRLKEYNQKP